MRKISTIVDKKMKRNERKIQKTLKLLNEVKDTLTVEELVALENTISRYVASRKYPIKPKKSVKKTFSDFSSAAENFFEGISE